MKKYLLEVVVFLSGAIVMIFELVGSRIMAPFAGTSIYVWTSLIGVILASLSIGYWRGGKLADKTLKQETLGFVLGSAAVMMAIALILKEPLLVFLSGIFVNIQLLALTGTIFLFAPASICLGMVSPYAIRLRINEIATSGSTVGNMFAISTVGSIAGTFLAGFFLVPFFGSTAILIFLAIMLLVIAVFLLALKPRTHPMMMFFVLAASAWTMFGSSSNIIDKDTRYSRVLIYEDTDLTSGNPVKIMLIDNHVGSAKFPDNNELVYDYLKYFDLATHFNPESKNTLMLGGAAYSYPSYFLEKYPNAQMDVVEIDPGLTELARQHFNLQTDTRLKIFHQDGRHYLRHTKEKYDVVYCDAFNALYSIPFHLTTAEAVKDIHRMLNTDGVVMVNILGSLSGEKSKFLRAEYITYKSVFPQVYLFPVQYPDDQNKLQNVMLVALKSKSTFSFNSADPYINNMLSHYFKEELKQDVPMLTDDYAPVQFYMN